MKNDKFQGLCLQSNEGYLLMDSYDRFDVSIRQRLSNSPYNICPACILDKFFTLGRGHKSRYSEEDNRIFCEIIEEFEDKIREGQYEDH